MKIPALRAKIGTWTYYVTSLTFRQVSEYVSKIDDQLHKSEGLKDLIQRSITDNYKSIKDYILKQPEVFFNSLVLAVYDSYPDWIEVELKYDDMETYRVGLLDFPSKHKIFPVDGQHRVEGIKAALLEKPELENERIAAIFIGHKNDEDGKKKTRRLFTTLNRYAKPVTLDDIIALDEDDVVAIVTRELLEEFDLFSGKRVIYAQQKAIPPSNKDAITSIITLYQAGIELFKAYYLYVHKVKLTKQKLDEILKFRRNDEEYSSFKNFSKGFWNSFKSITVIQDFLEGKKEFDNYRNSENGGNLIFRPIGFLPLVKAAIRIQQQTQKSYVDVFKNFNNLDFNISRKPWAYVLWNPLKKSMIMSSSTLTEQLLVYVNNKTVLKERELSDLKESYASRMSVEDSVKVKNILKTIKTN